MLPASLDVVRYLKESENNQHHKTKHTNKNRAEKINETIFFVAWVNVYGTFSQRQPLFGLCIILRYIYFFH